SGPGVSYAYVSRIEAGQREPSLKALRILARKLRGSLELLETGAAVSDAQDRQLRLADAELELSLGTDLRAAEESFRALLVDARESGDTYVEARARAGRGIALSALGEARGAVAELERALDTEAAVPELRPEAYRALACAYRELGMPQRAVALLERCVEELGQRPPGDEASTALYTTYLSQALEERGEAAGARIALLEARERLEAVEILEGDEAQGGAWYALGVAHALRNETDEADAAFRSAVDHLARGGDWREAARASREWARALRTAGRETEAFEVMEQATLLTVRGMGAEARRAH